MTKARRVRSTPRTDSPKRKQTVKPASKRSKIIAQAVVYAQSLAAYHAGFEADPTGDSEYAGKTNGITSARKALTKLNALSAPKCPGASTSLLFPDELAAKAKVIGLLYGLKEHEEPDEIEKTFIRIFAGEVLDFIAGHRAEVI